MNISKRFGVALAGAVAAHLGACASNDRAAASGPYATAMADNGSYRVEVRTAPAQPPTRGQITVQLAVKDATTGAPVDGLSVALVPWMPAMGHGTSVAPTVTASGGGVYVATGVNLFMPGTWELRATLTANGEAHATATIDVL